MYVIWTGAVGKPLGSISFASTPMARSSNTGMRCKPYQPPPTTTTRCSDTAEDGVRDIAGIRIPDSKLSVAALNLVEMECHASIYEHVLRTYVFGALTARAQGAKFDEEL